MQRDATKTASEFASLGAPGSTVPLKFTAGPSKLDLQRPPIATLPRRAPLPISAAPITLNGRLCSPAVWLGSDGQRRKHSAAE